MKQEIEVQDQVIKMNKIQDAITELIIEDAWRLSRRFMREIELEFECQGKLPLPLLLVSTNLQSKWIEYTKLN